MQQKKKTVTHWYHRNLKVYILVIDLLYLNIYIKIHFITLYNKKELNITN